MGGKALKNTYTERKENIEYNSICNDVVTILQKELMTDIHVVQSYRNKKSHGDLDVLIKVTSELHNKGINFVDFIKKTFNPNEIYNNGGVVSFDYRTFQIDFIPVRESNWDVSIGFFDFDPSGNLMGKVYHKFGLKYGFEGLMYPFRNFNGRLSQDILLSKDNRKIFEFLGYDYDRFLKGFDEIVEIFYFVIESKYFDSTIFQMDNLNQIDRKRNRKRQTYQDFLEFIKNKNINKVFPFKRKEDYIFEIDKYFPEANLINKLQELQKKDEQNKEMNSKFNGKLVMNVYPDLKGSELGNMITNFMKSFEDYRSFVLTNSSNDIIEEFKKFYELNKKGE